MIADLHTHTNASDGILRPHELVSRAKLHGVELLAITDHDTTDGIMEAQLTAQKEKIAFVAGIEFSCQWQGKGIHIVGLNIDIQNDELQSTIANQKATRQARAELIAERLSKAGFEGALEGARAIAGNAEIGRPHFAQYMVDKGLVRSAEQAFKRYLGNGKIGDVKQGWPEIRDIAPIIKAAGGRAVLAHPDKYKLTRSKLRACLADFVSAGGESIEVISGQQTPNTTRDMAQLCERFDLLASCGSDFHNPQAGWQALGRCGKLPENLKPVWHDWGIALSQSAA